MKNTNTNTILWSIRDANINDIRFNIAGPDNISLDHDTLKFGTRFGDIEELIPESYYLINDSKVDIRTRFIRMGEGIYGFSTGDPVPENSMLVIDPTTVRLWGTYYGGLDIGMKRNVLRIKKGMFTWQERPIHLIILLPPDLIKLHWRETWMVSWLSSMPAGQRQWGTYFGGVLSEELGSCIVSNSGSIYVSGNTSSTSGIASAGAHQTVYGGGGYDCYMEKFDPAGVRLWGTYYGGAGDDSPGYLTVDKQGNVYLTGSTTSDTGIATNGSWQSSRNGEEDAFLAKFDSNGVRQWGTYYGGELYDGANNCTTDSTGNVYIAGCTSSLTGIASPGAHQTTNGGEAGIVSLQNSLPGGKDCGQPITGAIKLRQWFWLLLPIIHEMYTWPAQHILTYGIATPGSYQPT